MKLADLICLTKKSNSSHVRAVSFARFKDREHIDVDPTKGTWSIGPTSIWTTYRKGPFKIGAGINPEYPGTYPHDLVGIYDRAKISHLDSMVFDAYSIGSDSSRGAV